MKTVDFGWLWFVNVGSSLNKCTTLVGDVDNEGGYVHVGAGSTWEIDISLSFAVNLTLL